MALLQLVQVLKSWGVEDCSCKKVCGEAAGAMDPDIVGGLVGEAREGEVSEGGVEGGQLVDGWLEGVAGTDGEVGGVVAG